MKTIRLIPRLDIKGPNLVKGIHLEGLRVLGRPNDFAQYYYSNGADELLYMDVVASLYERNSLQNVIAETAKEIFIPITVGGGLRTIEDIGNVLRHGADKVALNTAAVRNPSIIIEASKKYGSSTIVIAIETIKHKDGNYYSYTDNGREFTGLEVISWAKKVEELGAGELILTSVDKEGTGEGFDTELIRKVSETVSIPVIAHGGCSGSDDILNVIQNGKADAVSIASVLHYHLAKEKKSTIISKEGNTEFLSSGKTFSKINPLTITIIKKAMINANILTRTL